jgi:hypothetical protein
MEGMSRFLILMVHRFLILMAPQFLILDPIMNLKRPIVLVLALCFFPSGFAAGQNIATLPSIAGAAIDPANDKIPVLDASALDPKMRLATLAELVNVSSFTNGNFLAANAVEISQVNGLQAALDGKVSSTNAAVIAAVNAAVATDPNSTRNALGLNSSLTLSDAKTFSGQVELTGQAATNGTSAMTRDLTDARFARIFFNRADVVSSGVHPVTPTSVVSVTLPPGTYRYEYSIWSRNFDAGTQTHRATIQVASGSASYDLFRESRSNQGTYTVGCGRNITSSSGHDYTVTAVGASPNFGEGGAKLFGFMIVTSTAVVNGLFAHAVAPTNASSVEGYFLFEKVQ